MKPGQSVCGGCGAAFWPNQKWIHEGHFSPAPSRVTTPAVNDERDLSQGVVNTRATREPAASRQVAWQQEHRERYNEKMRGYMARRRAAGRVS